MTDLAFDGRTAYVAGSDGLRRFLAAAYTASGRLQWRKDLGPGLVAAITPGMRGRLYLIGQLADQTGTGPAFRPWFSRVAAQYRADGGLIGAGVEAAADEAGIEAEYQRRAEVMARVRGKWPDDDPEFFRGLRDCGVDVCPRVVADERGLAGLNVHCFN